MTTMHKFNFIKNVFCFFLVLYFIAPMYSNAVDIIINNDIVISAQVNSTVIGGGGGGGGGGITVPTIVNFSGLAYPMSKITILKNGVVAVTTTADALAGFSASINQGLTTGTYNFSVYGEDSNGIKSLSFTFPVYVTEGTTVNIGGIFLSPTIDIDKSEVKKGDNILVFGQTVPNTNIHIVFHSDQEILKQTMTGPTGLYAYSMNTAPLEYGNHNVKSKTLIDQDIRAISTELPFIVGLVSKLKDDKNHCGTLRGDLNCDGRVNLVDFSIMAYWYKKPSPPKRIDLSGDGHVTLVDFSIMAFNWTG